jgi:hypothetical protein
MKDKKESVVRYMRLPKHIDETIAQMAEKNNCKFNKMLEQALVAGIAAMATSSVPAGEFEIRNEMYTSFEL